MVREANVKQATAEKQLKEAQGKVGLFLSVCLSLTHSLTCVCVCLRFFRSMSCRLKCRL